MSAARNKQLVEPGTPMQTDGGVVAPTVATMVRRTELPSASEAVRLVSNTRRKLSDLPALPKQLNAYNVVLVYTAIGLSDSEIAVATGFTAEQLAALRQHDTYKMLEQLVVSTAREEAQTVVKGILVKAEESAARKIAELVDFEDPAIALKASRDILDRGGHKPRDEVDVRHTMLNTFRIEVVDRRNEKVIDVTPEIE